MIKRINIYDLDGTIIDSLHRYKTKNGKIDLDYWIKNDNAKMILKDDLLPLSSHYIESLENPEIYVIAATARACYKNDANYAYLYNVLGKPNMFVHREGRNDTRGGAELKITAIKPLLNLKQFQFSDVHIYEDNSDYLRDIAQAMRGGGRKVVGHYNPSYQGH